MKKIVKIVFYKRIFAGIFIIAYFSFNALFNQYLFSYQEQIQLFRFDLDYFTSFLTKPGGLTNYLGAFFIQFYFIPLIGAFIVTVAGIAVSLLTGYILRKYKIFGIIWSIIPVLFLFFLQSNPYFTLGYTLGLIFTLSSIALCITIYNNDIRYITQFIGFIFLYWISGGFSFLFILFCSIHELFFTKIRYRFFISLGYMLIAVIIPYLAWESIYYIPLPEAWSSLIFFQNSVQTRNGFLLLLLYYPCLLIVAKIRLTQLKKIDYKFGWNWKTFIVGFVLIAGFIFTVPVIRKWDAYNNRISTLLGIFYNTKDEKWDKVIKLSSKYSGTDPFIVSYTNLALYKSGQLGDKMFNFSQIGPRGLFLKWEEDNVTPIFGCEVFYQLGYFNEAYRWAFEAMVSTGQSPYLLKRLVLTSIINGNNSVAEKYIEVLNQSLFYRKWAQHYSDYLNNPTLLLKDNEINEKRHLLIHTDFFADLDNFDINLIHLLENHPENRMAFEYYMTSLLLGKNITEFASNINRLKDYGYKEIPLHYEEALIIYIVNFNENFVPKDYTIRESTIQRFKNYVDTYSPYFARKKQDAAKVLSKLYGNTYWFYSQFY